MHGIYSDSTLMLPTDWLVWVATSAVRLAVFRLEGWHGVFRLLHVGGTAAFFGAILVMDLRLLGLRGRDIPVAAVARAALPVTYAGFAVLFASGVMLFLYDPIQAGSHTWFVPKLLLILAGLLNAAVFSLPEGIGLRRIGTGALTRHARIAGALSILLWAGVIAAAVGNHEERPLIRDEGPATEEPEG